MSTVSQRLLCPLQELLCPVNDEHRSYGSAGVADHCVTVTHKFGDTTILREILANTHHEFSAYSDR